MDVYLFQCPGVKHLSITTAAWRSECSFLFVLGCLDSEDHPKHSVGCAFRIVPKHLANSDYVPFSCIDLEPCVMGKSTCLKVSIIITPFQRFPIISVVVVP